MQNTQKINKERAIKEKGVEKLISALLSVKNNRLLKIHRSILTEMFIDDKSTGKIPFLSEPREMIFNNSISHIINDLNEAYENAGLYRELKKEFILLEKRLEAYEESADNREKLSLEIRQFLTVPINETELSARVRNICQYQDIKLISDLVQYSRSDFAKLRNSGKKSGDEVEEYFKKTGLYWGMEV